MIKKQNKLLMDFGFLDLSNFPFVSDFELRISDFQ